MKNKIINLIRVVLTSNIVFFLSVSILLVSVVNFKAVEFGLKLRVVNHLMPESFNHLIGLAKGEQKVNKEELAKYIQFYHLIDKYFPRKADILSVLGFCCYYDGNIKAAEYFYGKAIDANADYFWPYYNLAIINFKNNDIGKANLFFGKASKLNLDKTYNFILSSKVILRSLIQADVEYAKVFKGRLINAKEVSEEMSEYTDCIINNKDCMNFFKDKVVLRLGLY